jgi:hypothetical protein
MALRMRLSLQPNGRVAHTRPHSYIVELPGGASAIVDAVDGKGWHLTVRDDGKALDRGLFASTEDVLAFLEAEFTRER